jgi:hypothetical protein
VVIEVPALEHQCRRERAHHGQAPFDTGFYKNSLLAFTFACGLTWVGP